MSLVVCHNYLCLAFCCVNIFRLVMAWLRPRSYIYHICRRHKVMNGWFRIPGFRLEYFIESNKMKYVANKADSCNWVQEITFTNRRWGRCGKIGFFTLKRILAFQCRPSLVWDNSEIWHSKKLMISWATLRGIVSKIWMMLLPKYSLLNRCTTLLETCNSEACMLNLCSLDL